MMKQGNGHWKNEKKEENAKNDYIGKEGQDCVNDNMKEKSIISNVKQPKKADTKQI